MTYFSVHDPWSDVVAGSPRFARRGCRPFARPVTQLLGIIAAEMTTGDPATARRFALRACVSPRATLDWIAELDRLRVHAGADSVPFDLARRPTQRFVHNALPMTTRLHLLRTHYRCLMAHLPVAAVYKLLADEEIVISSLLGKSGSAYSLKMSRNTMHKQEGEIILKLCRESDGTVLGSLSFVAGSLRDDDQNDLWIGGLQGCKASDSKAAIISATKDLWGLRPKNLLMHGAYALADVLGLRAIRAVSNAGHVHRRPKLQKAWSADYDHFWSELGGRPAADGFFVLPRTPHRRSPDAVPAPKRRAWLIRQSLVVSLRTSAFEILGRRGAPPWGAPRIGVGSAPTMARGLAVPS